jgi:hypothetical protein
MELKEFWNKAIEFYCTYNDPKRLTYFETVFIAISEDSLERVKEKYIKEGGLLEEQIQVLKNKIENSGGVNSSYYTAIRDVHNSFNYPEQYSFLRFSILVVGAFKHDDSSLRDYWIYFNPFLQSKNIKVINDRTSYINKLILNLAKLCQIKYNKIFFQLNIFGENSGIVNVGRIKAHSIFQGTTLKKIKKSIYNLGYSDSHNIEDLTLNDIKEIIEDSGTDRIMNLFQRDEETKEIIFVCLKIWLENWIPNQEEKVKLLEGKTPINKSKIQIYRIWIINNENEIEIKYGFNFKSEIGENNIFYLNKSKNVYVDVTWGVKLNENRILYIIENYSGTENFDNNELGVKFSKCDLELNNFQYALEKITNRLYFIEHDKEKIKIQDNPILLASKSPINKNNIIYFNQCKIKNQQNLEFNLYRINDSFDYQGLSFIKTNKLDIYPIGITDGKPGIKSFISNFPIKIKWNNLSKGNIHIIYNNEIYLNLNLSEEINNLQCSKDIGLLKAGNYCIKYFNCDENYEIFLNGRDSIEFEIVESGNKDRRREIKTNIIPNFEYHEFRRLKNFQALEDSFVILPIEEDELKVEDKHIDFYFTKNNENEWIIRNTNEIKYLQLTLNKPIQCELIYDIWEIEVSYLSKKFKKYIYKIKFCKRPERVKLPFDLKKFHINNEDHRINSAYIYANCYYYKLIEMDEDLQNRYPNVSVGDEIFIISNIQKSTHHEALLMYINQEFFPFKK